MMVRCLFFLKKKAKFSYVSDLADLGSVPLCCRSWDSRWRMAKRMKKHKLEILLIECRKLCVGNP